MTHIIWRNCDECGRQYRVDLRNFKRGWGLCCSKSCAARQREKAKRQSNAEKTERNGN